MARQDVYLYRTVSLEHRSQQSRHDNPSAGRPATEGLLYHNRILLTVGFCFLLICTAFPCLAAEQEDTLTLTAEQKAALVKATTWKVLVQADYGTATAYEGLPVAEDCRRLLQYGGWQIVDDEAAASDAILEIQIKATPLTSSYTYLGGGGSRRHYDTVNIEMSGQITLHGQQIATLAKAQYRYDAYYNHALQDRRGNQAEESPFIHAYYLNGKFFSPLLSLLYQVRGFKPIKSAITDPVSVKLYPDFDWTIRGIALNAIDFAGQTKDSHFFEDLSKVLTADDDPALRKRAAKALGMLGQPAAVEPLCQILLTDDKDDVRQASAEALGELGLSDAAESLCQALMTDKENDVREAAAVSLGKLGGQTAINALAAAFRSGNAALNQITDSLHKLDWQPESMADKVLFLLAKGSSQKLNDEERIRQLKALGDDAIPHLLKALEHPVSGINERSLSCLGRLKCKTAVEPICNILATGSITQRRVAASALGEIGDTASLESLLQALLTDTDLWVRVAAAEALGKIGDAKATNGLVQALTDSSEKVRAAAFKALGVLNWQPATTKEKVWSWISGGKPDDVLGFGREAAPIVLELLERDDTSIQQKAMKLAGELKLAEAIEPISKFMIGDGYSGYRAEAARALGQIGRAEARAALSRALLNDKEKDVRAAAAEALGKLNEPECVPLLLNTLDDEDAGVRKAVVQSLGVYGGDDVVQALGNRFKQEIDADIKQMIFDTLSKLKAQTDDMPFPYTARKLAEEKKVMELKARLKEQPLETLVELLKIDNRVLTNAVGFELMQRTEQYDLGTDYTKWKQWLEEKGPNDQPK